MAKIRSRLLRSKRVASKTVVLRSRRSREHLAVGLFTTRRLRRSRTYFRPYRTGKRKEDKSGVERANEIWRGGVRYVRSSGLVGHLVRPVVLGLRTTLPERNACRDRTGKKTTVIKRKNSSRIQRVFRTEYNERLQTPYFAFSIQRTSADSCKTTVFQDRPSRVTVAQ